MTIIPSWNSESSPASGRARFGDQSGRDAVFNPVEFVQKHYASEIAAKTLHRALIRREDPDLDKALTKWLRTKSLPAGIQIPTLPEWNSARLAELGPLSPNRTISLLVDEDDRCKRQAIKRLYEVWRKRPHSKSEGQDGTN